MSASRYDDDMPKMDEWHRCELCGRRVPETMITLHHLTPREKGGKAEHRVEMCRPCHKQVHALFSNAQLAKGFPSIEALRQAPELQTFIRWIRRQNPSQSFPTHTSSAHRRARKRRR